MKPIKYAIQAGMAAFHPDDAVSRALLGVIDIRQRLKQLEAELAVAEATLRVALERHRQKGEAS
jgi:hypothetical protein